MKGVFIKTFLIAFTFIIACGGISESKTISTYNNINIDAVTGATPPVKKKNKKGGKKRKHPAKPKKETGDTILNYKDLAQIF